MIWYGIVVQVHTCRQVQRCIGTWNGVFADEIISGQGQAQTLNRSYLLGTKVNKHNILLFFGIQRNLPLHFHLGASTLPTSKDQFLGKSTNQPPFSKKKDEIYIVPRYLYVLLRL